MIKRNPTIYIILASFLLTCIIVFIVQDQKSLSETELPIEYEVNLIATGWEELVPRYGANERYSLAEDNRFTGVVNARNSDHLEELASRANITLPSDMSYDTNAFVFAYGRKLNHISAIRKNGNFYILKVVFDQQYFPDTVFVYALPPINIYPFDWAIYYLEDNEHVFWPYKEMNG